MAGLLCFWKKFSPQITDDKTQEGCPTRARRPYFPIARRYGFFAS